MKSINGQYSTGIAEQISFISLILESDDRRIKIQGVLSQRDVSKEEISENIDNLE